MVSNVSIECICQSFWFLMLLYEKFSPSHILTGVCKLLHKIRVNVFFLLPCDKHYFILNIFFENCHSILRCIYLVHLHFKMMITLEVSLNDQLICDSALKRLTTIL